MAHSDCGWMCGCARKTVNSFENTCHTWALLRWWFTTKRRYIKCMDLYLTFTNCALRTEWWREQHKNSRPHPLIPRPRSRPQVRDQYDQGDAEEHVHGTIHTYATISK